MNKKPLKILHVNTADIIGGAALSAYGLYKATRAKGHSAWLAVRVKKSKDPNVFTIPNQRNQIKKFIFEQFSDSHLRACIEFNWKYKSSRISYYLNRALGLEPFCYPGSRELLNLPPERPDILHLHNLHGYYFDLRYLQELSGQVPVVLNLRDMWTFTGHCGNFKFCNRWKTGCGNCPDLTIYPDLKRDGTAINWKRKKRIYENSRLYITTPSKWLMDQVHSSMLTGVDYRVIPNAIGLSVFRPNRQKARRELNIANDTVVILFSAHNQFKDMGTIIKVLSNVSAPEGKKLLFISLGGKVIAGDKLGDGKLYSPGFINDMEKTAKYFQAADIFVHAATGEIFGRTLAEAMACGVPIAAVSVQAVPEVVDDGETGFVSERGDSDSMVHNVQLLIDNENLRKEMGARGVEKARKIYGLEKQADAFLNWYGEILANFQHINELGV